MNVFMSAPRLPRYAVRSVLFGLGVWLSIALVTAGALWHERMLALDHGKQSASATVALMEQHTAATFHAVALALDDMARLLAEHDYANDDPRVRQRIGRLLRDMPYVRDLYVVDADGTVIHDTAEAGAHRSSVAGRDYFRAYKADPSLLSAVSAPLQSRTGGAWIVPMTRRIDGPVFRGIVVAAIQMRYFDDLYLRMGLGPGQQIVLFHRDGTLLAQYPQQDVPIGKSYVEYPLFKMHLPVSLRGVYEVSSPPLEPARILSYAALESQPLVVGMVQSVDAVLGSWRRGMAFAAFGLSLLLVVITAAVGQFIYHESHERRVRERLFQGEKLEALGQLTGGIAHDFGNVLGVVGNSVELLQHLISEENEYARRAVANAAHAIEAGRRLTQDLMAFARKRELRVTTIDLHDALTRSLPMLKQAAGPRIQVEVGAEPGALCQVDYIQLEVALVNLVVNARDAMQAQGTIHILGRSRCEAPARLRVRGHAREFVGVTVSDTGSGMTEEIRKRALEPFFTTKGEQGTGLGLSQVYGFVKQVNGELSIDSSPGRGTSVHLYFPAVAA
jgi:signal transduction histidine kinase